MPCNVQRVALAYTVLFCDVVTHVCMARLDGIGRWHVLFLAALGKDLGQNTHDNDLAPSPVDLLLQCGSQVGIHQTRAVDEIGEGVLRHHLIGEALVIVKVHGGVLGNHAEILTQVQHDLLGFKVRGTRGGKKSHEQGHARGDSHQ